MCGWGGGGGLVVKISVRHKRVYERPLKRINGLLCIVSTSSKVTACAFDARDSSISPAVGKRRCCCGIVLVDGGGFFLNLSLLKFTCMIVSTLLHVTCRLFSVCWHDTFCCSSACVRVMTGGVPVLGGFPMRS